MKNDSVSDEKNCLFHGLLLVDKPSGITSHDVVAKLRKILKTKSIGHSGTLDPLASGLMVCLVNEATKLSNYILEQNKSYRVGIQFGIETDTLDVTGQIIKTHDFKVDSEKVKAKVRELTGDFMWEVPIYSAMKVDGQKLYEYARKNEMIALPKKEMKFWNIQIHSITPEGADIELTCSKGSFIRTWVSQLGQALGYGATMRELRRTRSEPYSVEQACTLDMIDPFSEMACFVPMLQVFPQMKRIFIKGHDLGLLKNGQISHDLRIQLIQKFDPDKDQLIQIFSQHEPQLLALIGVEPQSGFKIRRVFKY